MSPNDRFSIGVPGVGVKNGWNYPAIFYLYCPVFLWFPGVGRPGKTVIFYFWQSNF